MLIKATLEIGIEVPEGSQVFNGPGPNGMCIILPTGERISPWVQFDLTDPSGDESEMGVEDMEVRGVSFDYIDRHFSPLDGNV